MSSARGEILAVFLFGIKVNKTKEVKLNEAAGHQPVIKIGT